MATLIVGIVLVAFCGVVVARMIRNRKKGSACSGCSGCSSCSACAACPSCGDGAKPVS